MDEIKIPERAIGTIRKLFYERSVVEAKITNYLSGLIDSFGLEGENWTLDTNAMVLRQIEESPNGVVKDAVGTTTGDIEGKSYG